MGGLLDGPSSECLTWGTKAHWKLRSVGTGPHEPHMCPSYIFLFPEMTNLTWKEPLVFTWPYVSQNSNGKHLKTALPYCRTTQGRPYFKVIRSEVISELDPTCTVF